MIQILNNEHGYASALVVWRRDPDAEQRCEDATQLRVHQLRNAQHALWLEFEQAILDRASKLIRDVYPTATALRYDGEENEDGLLHTYVRAILDADGKVMDDQDDPSDQWRELVDEDVEPLLWEVSERDQSYHGEGKTLELD